MILRRALAGVWTVLVLGLHSIPRYRLLQVPGGDTLVKGSGPDKLAHAALFVILGILWSHAFPRRGWLVLAVGIAYGFALEVYQTWLIAGRTGSAADAAADAIGMVLGLVLAVSVLNPGRSR